MYIFPSKLRLKHLSHFQDRLNLKKQSCHSKFIITFEIKRYYENSCRFWKLSSFSFEQYATRLCNLYISISKWGSNTCFTSMIDLTSNQQSCHCKFIITFEIKCNDESSSRFWKLSSLSFERYATRLCVLCNSISNWGSNICYTSKIDLTSNQQSCHSKFIITFDFKCVLWWQFLQILKAEFVRLWTVCDSLMYFIYFYLKLRFKHLLHFQDRLNLKWTELP